MVYIKDFQYLKPRNSYLQTFETTTTATRKPSKPPTKTSATTSAKNNTLTGILKPYFKEYCDISSIHCFRYFTDNKLKHFEKAIWILIVLTTSICCTIVYFDLANLYKDQRVQTTVSDSVYPVFMIPFPSVGICLRYRIDWPRLQNEAAKKFLPPDVNNETLHTFYTFFEHLADAKLQAFNRLSPLFESASGVNLSLIDNVDILSVMGYLAFPCAEVFRNTCNWRYKTYNCCDLFTLERTELGFCYVFNSAVSEEMEEKAKSNKFYPYHNSNSGESSGLEVDVLLNQEKIKPGFRFFNGVYVMIKQAEQWHSDVKFINYNTFTKLAITGQLTETDEQTRVIQPKERGCIFQDETTSNLYKKIPGLLYWRGNCRTRCHQEYVLKYCNCNLSLLFPANKLNNFTACKPSDFKCIFENANVFSYEHHEFERNYIDDGGNDSMTCNCLNSCNQLLYDGFYSSFPLEGVESSNPVKMVHLDIHFQASYILKYRKQMRYTFVELLANFGGIIGLFLGASLLSAIELIYYFTIGLYIRFHKQFEEKYCKNTYNSHKCNNKYKIVKISTLEPTDIYKY